jgi:glycosyltransferase involved in cell wall biosynthesis
MNNLTQVKRRFCTSPIKKKNNRFYSFNKNNQVFICFGEKLAIVKSEEEKEVVLSIITPVFNGVKYIRKCLSNVAEQAFPGLEHLIMDGGSSDGTVDEIRFWMEKYSHIRLISEKDSGQSNAMNKGIRLAKGRIIGFLNVDDYYEPGVLKGIPDLFNDMAEPAFICGNLNIWNPDGSFYSFNKPDKISLIQILSDLYEWPYNPSAYFYHKSLHDIAGFYNEENHYCMDYEFILEAARHIRLRHIDQLWGNFCTVADSKTQLRFNENLQEAYQDGLRLRNAKIKELNNSEKKELDTILKNNLQTSMKQGLPVKIAIRIKKIISRFLK